MKNKQHFVSPRNRTNVFIGATLIALLTAGCTTMLAHERLSLGGSYAFGSSVAEVEICGNLSLVNKKKAERLLSASKTRLNRTVYDEASLERGKQTIISYFKTANETSIRKRCAHAAKNIDEATDIMVQANHRMTATRSRDMASMANSLSSLGSALSGTPSYRAPNYQFSQPLTYSSPKIEPITPNRINVTPLYNADDCIGSSVNGMCYGSVLPKAKPSSYCRGIVVNGQCSGAVTSY